MKESKKEYSVLELYQNYIHKSRYARYRYEDNRRETWEETVTRYIDFIWENAPKNGTTKNDIYRSILNKEVMPSMRALMTAGPALARDNVAGYNCAYVPIDSLKSFDEIMYILLCGTGVGFSVERQYTDTLPTVPELFEKGPTIIVRDSKLGWAEATRKYIQSLSNGLVPEVDTSRIRPSGSPLHTFGGTASGPEPLVSLFTFIKDTFLKAKGRRLTSLECHDIVCKIGASVVVGGVRRSALLSLSNLTDSRMATAKTGQWYYTEPQRTLANNSVCYTEKPDPAMFLKEWTNLIESKSGERGIFYRGACESALPERREGGYIWGTNPCSEIILRPRQFCNLTEVVIREDDDLKSLKEKVELATILGTIQSTFTDFRYLPKAWKDNCEDERLLGVSLTGICDNPLMYTNNDTLKEILTELKNVAIDTNKTWAAKLGIARSAAITCVKPSGTVSQLVGCSSGIHPRFSESYIRRVRSTVHDPINQVLIKAGVPYELDITNSSQYVFSFPIKSTSRRSLVLENTTAIEQLELWKTYSDYWCEHKPSVSIYVKDSEWVSVGAWVFENFESMSGVSFFPRDDHIYEQAPYEEITGDHYNILEAGINGHVSFDIEERRDSTTSSQELACAGGACEL